MKPRKKRSVPLYILFLIISFLFIFIYSMLANVLYPTDLADTNLLSRLKPPSFLEGGSPEYLLGTDSLGRDFFVRLIYGTRNSLLISMASMVIACTLGVALGVLSGLCGGWVDQIISFVVDARLSIPFTIIAIVCASIFGRDKFTLMMIMGLTGWATFARLIRGQILQLKELSFMECSRAMGASRMRILFEHVLKNIASPLIVEVTMKLGGFILLESSLSFLGLGIQPPDVSLGIMVSNGRDYLINYPWLTLVPGGLIVIVTLQFSLVGDWLRDKLDPKMRSNR